MIGSVAWKEYREGRTVWLALALLGAGCVLLLPVFMDFLGQSDPRQQHTSVALTLVVLAVTYGVVAGSMLLAGEREGGTQVFLDGLTARRHGLWLAKLQVGAVAALTQGVALAVPFLLAAPDPEESTAAVLWLLPALTLEALTWGLLSSAFAQTVLSSAGLGGLLYTASWLVTFVLGAAVRAEAHEVLVRVPLDGLALACSYFVFCRTDLERRGAGAATVRERGGGGSPAVAAPRAPAHHSAWRSLAWLAWRQGRGEFFTLSAALFVFGLAFAPYLVRSWPLWTLLTGVVFGTGAWRAEQSDGSYRFLSNQRFPPGRVWLVKTAFGLLAALLVVGAAALGGLCHFLAQQYPHGLQAWSYRLGLDLLVLFNNPPVVALVWVICGFAAGQLVGMLCRKNLVAVMLSLPAGLVLLGPWGPSLVTGGLPAWQVFVVPAVLLAAARLVMWEWASDRLPTRRPALALGGCALAAVLFVAGCLTQRVVEVPDVGAPFDVEEFRASIPSGEQNRAGDQIRRALNDLSGRWREGGFVERAPGPGRVMVGPAEPVAMARPPVAVPPPSRGPAAELRERVLREGWPQEQGERERLGRWLDELFVRPRGAGPPLIWWAMLEQAVRQPLGVFEDPGRVATRAPLLELAECSSAAVLYRLRATQLQAGGDDAGALAHLDVLLALSRHLRNKALPRPFVAGLEVEAHALAGLEVWLRGRPQGGDVLRDALRRLGEHEEGLPPVTDVLKASYLGAYQRLLDEFLVKAGDAERVRRVDRTYGQFFLLAQYAPWERARTQRLIDAHYAARLAGRRPPPPREALDQAVWTSGPVDWPKHLQAAERSLCRLRAMRQQAALAQFERERGRAAGALGELVPDYLPALPADPFTGRPFGYRVSRGETMAVPSGDLVGAPEVAVAAGQGVLWSTGPDGVDHGGKVQAGRGAGHPSARPQTDWIFLVPRR